MTILVVGLLPFDSAKLGSQLQLQEKPEKEDLKTKISSPRLGTHHL